MTKAGNTISKGLQTRAAILDAALDIASRDGLEGLSIGMLADALGMSKSGVFAHFGSREDLQIALIDEYARRFMEAVFYPRSKSTRLNSSHVVTSRMPSSA